VGAAGCRRRLLGLLLIAIPQMYGVGYPVMTQAIAGNEALWFLLILMAAKMVAASLTIGIGGSGGVFAPSLFTGAMAGTALGVIARHLLGPAVGAPAIYGIVAMGAVFAAAAQAPLTSIASVAEMTGNYTLLLPVMLAVAVATGVARKLSNGTIYTRKLMRRGMDIDQFPRMTTDQGTSHGPARGLEADSSTTSADSRSQQGRLLDESASGAQGRNKAAAASRVTSLASGPTEPSSPAGRDRAEPGGQCKREDR
jgi:Voltage gated chloride channel